MSRGKKLLILVLAFAVLLSAYLIVRQTQTKTDETADLPVLTLQEDDVGSLSWNAGTDDGELTLSRQGDGWVYDGDPDHFPLDQSAAETMVQAVCSVTASQQLTEPDALSAYGLDQPSATVTVTLQDGTSYTLALGDQNSVTQEYYLLLDGESVWTVDGTLKDDFAKGLCDLVEKEALPNFGEVQKMSIQGTSGTKTLTYVENNAGLWYTDSYHWFLEDDAGTRAVGDEKVTELYQKVTGLSWISCIRYHAAEADLAAYGLDRASATLVSLDYLSADQTQQDAAEQTETFTLRIGTETNDGYYACIDGSQMVYLISPETVESILSADYAGLRPDDVCLLDQDTVRSMDITESGTTGTVTYLGTKETATGTTSSDGKAETEIEDVYQIDGTSLDSDLVNTLFDQITGLQMAGLSDSVPGDDPLLTITFHRDTENDPDMTLTVYPYTTDQDLVTFHNETMLISSSDAGNLLSAAEAVLGE